MKRIQVRIETRKILADIITPVSIYLKIRDIYPNSLLLESSDYHGKENSYSFICMDPIAEFQVNKGMSQFNLPGEDGNSTAPFAASKRQLIPRGPRVSLRGSRIVVRREMPLARDLYQDGRSEVVFEPRPIHGLGQLECGWCRFSTASGELNWIGQELQFGIGESVTEYLLDDFNGDGTPDLATLSTGFNFDEAETALLSINFQQHCRMTEPSKTGHVIRGGVEIVFRNFDHGQ